MQDLEAASCTAFELAHRLGLDICFHCCGQVSYPTTSITGTHAHIYRDAQAIVTHLRSLGDGAVGRAEEHPSISLSETNYQQAGIGLPTLVDNDANASAWHRSGSGAARHTDNFILVQGESGVGCGIVINGDIFRGAHDLAREVGHTTIDLARKPYAYSNTGCLELCASPSVVESGAATRVSETAGGDADRVTCEAFARVTQKGNAAAADTLRGMGGRLATA